MHLSHLEISASVFCTRRINGKKIIKILRKMNMFVRNSRLNFQIINRCTFFKLNKKIVGKPINTHFLTHPHIRKP